MAFATLLLKTQYADFIPNTEVTEISIYELINLMEFIVQKNEVAEIIMTNKIIIATGRNGAEFVKNICTQFNIPMVSNAVDIGVRVEMKD